MSKHVAIFVGILGAVGLVDLAVLLSPVADAQEPMVKKPTWLYGLAPRVRKAGEANLTPETKRTSIELFRDENNGQLLYVSETGSLALAPPAADIPKDTKPATALFGLDYRVRKAGEGNFGNETKKWGAETIRDENTGYLLFVSETGSIAEALAKDVPADAKPQPATWLYGQEVRVRKGGEKDFTPMTQKFGLEVFRDENTGYTIYVTETGAVAVLSARTETLPVGEKPKAPTWLYGLEVYARKGDEKDFTPTTKKWGIEVFFDENSGNTVYMTETGSIALLPGKIEAPAKTKPPTFLHGMNVGSRKGGSADFNPMTQKLWGVEVFKDENSGATFYISETGSITLVPAK
jgi:hypothetical protein